MTWNRKKYISPGRKFLNLKNRSKLLIYTFLYLIDKENKQTFEYKVFDALSVLRS